MLTCLFTLAKDLIAGLNLTTMNGFQTLKIWVSLKNSRNDTAGYMTWTH